MNLFFILSIPVSIILINFFLNKLEVLQSLTGDKHQFFVAKKKIPLSGGLLIVIYSFFLLPFGNELFYFFLIFLIGILSDTKMINSAKIRFLIQFIFIFFLVVKFQLNLDDIKVPFINYFLEYNIFSYSFFAFCLLIVINGTNFIDGLNGLVIGYYSIVLSIILFLGFEEIFFDMNGIILNYLLILFFLLIFNFFDRLYLGDSGSYLIGFALGALLISIYKEIPFFSPFFIVLLLWYPCFENLFSILRKFQLKKSPIKPDSNHLHQILFFYLKKKYKLRSISANNNASLIILLYNLIIFSIGIQNISNTQFQIILLIINILIYCAIYFKLFAYKYKLKI